MNETEAERRAEQAIAGLPVVARTATAALREAHKEVDYARSLLGALVWQAGGRLVITRAELEAMPEEGDLEVHRDDVSGSIVISARKGEADGSVG